MFKLLGVVFAAMCLMSFTHAQNLVPNPSFETYVNCPVQRNDGILPNNWTQPTTGTSDYFNSCVTGNGNNLPDVPNNFVGNQNARTGNAYMGVYVNLELTGQFAGYREYMQVQLLNPLIAGFTYKFEMYVSLADESEFASNKLGVYISSQKISSTSNGVLNFTPQIVTPNYITSKTAWTKVSGTYLATGGEQYITIGCFNANNNGSLQAVTGGNGGGWNVMCYYYIDDVSLEPDCSMYENLPNIVTEVCTTPTALTTLRPSILNASSYLWNTGLTNNNIQVNTSGTYSVRMLVGPCFVYDTIILTRNLFPTIDLGKDTAVCTNEHSNVLLIPTYSSASNFLWNTGDTTANILVNTSGKYKLTITENNCSSADSVNVNFINPPVFSLGADTTLCFNSSIELSANVASATYLWNTGSTNNRLNVSQVGTYSLRVTANGCSFTDSIRIQFKNNPNLNLGIDTAICPYQINVLDASAANASAYVWHNGSTQPTFSHTGGGLFWVRITKENCNYTDTIIVSNKELPIVDLGPDIKFCKENNFSINITLTNVNTYLWIDGSSGSPFTANKVGKYWLKVTGGNGCYAADTILADTFTSPQMWLGNDTSFCENTSIQLQPNTSFNSYSWQDGSTQPTYLCTTPGKYILTVTDNNNCKAIDTIVVNQLPKPTLFLPNEVGICRNDTTLVARGNFISLLWDNGSTTPEFVINREGRYSISVTGENGCVNSKNIDVVSNCPASIYVPSAFSPNSDGYNDDFFAAANDIVSFRLEIYNRWGSLVFETTNTKDKWDGTVNGEFAPNDVYVWVIQYTGADKVSGKLNGQVTLLR